MKNIVFICHSIYFSKEKVFDANHSITFGFLDYYFGDQYSVVRHSLYQKGELRFYNKGINGFYVSTTLLSFFPDSIRYFLEIIVNFVYLVITHPETVIAIDPLCALAPTVIKKIGLIKKVFFITPDFSKKRFSNKTLNRIYFNIDRFCTKNTDKNVCCSQIVIEQKIKIYGEAIKDKLFHMPNIPNPWIVDKIGHIKKIKNRIIYAGNIAKHMNFYKIFDVILRLQQQYKDLSFVLAGEGEDRKVLEEYLSQKKATNIYFLGQLSYEDTLSEIAKAEMGIALYNGEFTYDELRDSCKIREYQAFGTIPIASRIVKSNVSEIIRYKSGFLVDHEDEMQQTIEKILNDQQVMEQTKENCYKNNALYGHKYSQFYQLITR